MRLALPAVAAHQPAVRVLPAGVFFDDALAQARAGGVVAGVEIQVAQPAQGVEIGQAQALPGERGPVLVGVVGQEVAAVEPARELVVTRRLVDLPRVLEPAAGFHAAVELVDVEP